MGVAPTHAPLAVERKHPVIEVFGPTVQGEGPDAGRPCHFVRFGGCDYRCSWCDSMHAVEPHRVRANARKLDRYSIVGELSKLTRGPQLVVLSGGNPALHHLDKLVGLLHDNWYDVSVETQGSVWRDWLGDVDTLVVSPKPPSSGMVTDHHDRQLDNFMECAYRAPSGKLALKVVVFDDIDLEWAIDVHRRFPATPFWLSAGTDPPTPLEPIEVTRKLLGDRWRWLIDTAASHPALADARMLPQLHVVAYGHALGV